VAGSPGRALAIAGAAGNLGPLVVRRLAEADTQLCLCGRDRAELEETAAGIEAADLDVVDLLDAEQTRAWANALVERHGRVDGLVHLVGGYRGGVPIEEASLDDWDFLSALLVRTLQHVTQAFAPQLLASPHGRFVLVSSSQAQAPTHRNASYAAAKAAAEAWTLALAHRFRGTDATANLVVVSAIVTPAMRSENPDQDYSTFTPAEEIADAVAYLCSDAASSMNGQRLTLRGAA
jgi:NAD(P)-dependent dehydrogenase (short-subunit alcohol dehydrogenase family)